MAGKTKVVKKVATKSVAKKASAPKISVKVAALMKPLETYQVVRGTELLSFLSSHNIAYGSTIRVNGERVTKTYKLGAGDIITVVGAVNGG